MKQVVFPVLVVAMIELCLITGFMHISQDEYRVCNRTIDCRKACSDPIPEGYHDIGNMIVSIKDFGDSVAVFWSYAFEHNIAESSIWIRQGDEWRLLHTEPSEIGNSTDSRHYIKLPK